MTRRSVAAFALAVLLGSIAAACGLPIDSEPRLIAESSLPRDLVEYERPTPDPNAIGMRVWMVGPDNRLLSVRRQVDPDPHALINALLLDTFPNERAQGITSAISRATTVDGVFAGDDGVWFVELAEGSVVSSSREDRLLAFAQMVYTLTEIPEVLSVSFLVDSTPISVPTDDGASRLGQAVTRASYEDVAGSRVVFPDDEAAAPTVPTPPVIVATPNPTTDTRVRLPIWLIDRDDHLIRVERLLNFTPEAMMASVLQGPEVFERQQGLRSALRPNAAAVSIDVNEADGTAFVDLVPNSLPAVDSEDRKRAVAQIVYTLTELAEIERVAFLINGEWQPMPTDSGQSAPAAELSRFDFVSLEPGVSEVPTPEPTPTPEPNPDSSTDTDADLESDGESGG